MAKKKDNNVTQLAPVNVVVPDILGGIAGKMYLRKLGAPGPTKGEKGFHMDATLEVSIGDDEASTVQLPLELNPFKARLKLAANAGRTESIKRRLKAPGTIELADFIDGVPTLAFDAPLAVMLKSDELLATPKRSRYTVVATVYVQDSAGIARLVDLLDLDVRVRFEGKGKVEALKGNGYGESEGEDAGVEDDDLPAEAGELEDAAK